MYGSWITVTVGVGVVVLLLIAAVLTAWTPIFAIAIAIAVIAVMALFMSARRAGSERQPESEGGLPQSGDSPSEGAAESSSDGAAPRVTAGIWGER